MLLERVLDLQSREKTGPTHNEISRCVGVEKTSKAGLLTLAYRARWYALEVPRPLRRITDGPLRMSAFLQPASFRGLAIVSLAAAEHRPPRIQ